MRMCMNKCINVNKKLKLYVYDYCSNVFCPSAYDEINIIMFLIGGRAGHYHTKTKLEDQIEL